LRSDIESPVEPAEVELPEGRPRTTLDLAAAKLHTALQQRTGYVVVTAETSERAEALFSAVEPRLRTFRTVRASGHALDPEAIVRALWRDGDAPFPARLAMRALIDEARAAEQPIVVVITDADAADPARLERVRLTLEGAPDAGEIVHIALLGGPALIELLRRPETRAVALRIGATVQVPAVAADLGAALRTPVATPRRAGTLAIVALAAMAGVVGWAAWRRMTPTPLATTAAPVSPPPVPAVHTAPPPAAVIGPVATAAPEHRPERPTPEPPVTAHAEPTAPPSRDAAAAETTPPASRDVAAGTEPTPPVSRQATTPGQPTPSESPPATAAPVPAPSAESPAPATPPYARVYPSATASHARTGALQVGAFVNPATADALRARLAPRFPGVAVSPATRDGTTYHRVRVGGFASAQELDDVARALRAAGFTPVRVRE
jgi:cell division protein FtsN